MYRSSIVKCCSLSLLAVLALTVGCRTTYYSMWEKLGKEKRHLLKDDVEDVRDEQAQASEQFQDALTRLRTLYEIDGGELETFYDGLKADYERCQADADAVKAQIEEMDTVANDLFEEWREEIQDISTPSLQAASRQQLAETQNRYADLYASVKQAEQRMNDVLTKMQDYVLYIKHNLNARAVGALRTEAEDIEREIGRLIQDMNRSIAEAEAFAETL